jgi:hypothetical protein
MREQLDAVASKHARRGDQALASDEVRKPEAAAALHCARLAVSCPSRLNLVLQTADVKTTCISAMHCSLELSVEVVISSCCIFRLTHGAVDALCITEFTHHH